MARRPTITLPTDRGMTRLLSNHTATTHAVGRRGLFAGISRAAQQRMKNSGAAKGQLPNSGLAYFYSKFADSIDPIFDKVGRDEMSFSEFLKHLKSAGVSDREISWYRLRAEYADDAMVGRQEMTDYAARQAPDIAAVWNYGRNGEPNGAAHVALRSAGINPDDYTSTSGRDFSIFTREASDEEVYDYYMRSYATPSYVADEIVANGFNDDSASAAAEFLDKFGAGDDVEGRDVVDAASTLLETMGTQDAYKAVEEILRGRGHKYILETYAENRLDLDRYDGTVDRPASGFVVRADGKIFGLDGFYSANGGGYSFRIEGLGVDDWGREIKDGYVEGADIPRLMTSIGLNKHLNEGYDRSTAVVERPAFGDVIPDGEERWYDFVSPLAKKPKRIGVDDTGRSREVAIYGPDADGDQRINDDWGHEGLSGEWRGGGRGSMFHWRGHDAAGPAGVPERGIYDGEQVVDTDRSGFLELHEGQSDYISALRSAEEEGDPIVDLPVSSTQSAAKNIINHAIRHAIESGLQGVYLPDPMLPAAAWKQIYGPPPRGSYPFTFAAGPDGKLNAQPRFLPPAVRSGLSEWLRKFMPRGNSEREIADRARLVGPIPVDSYAAARARINEMTLHGNPIFASDDADLIAAQLVDLARTRVPHGGEAQVTIKGLPQERLLMSNSYDTLYKTMAGEAERAAKELGGRIVAEKPDPRDRYGWHRRALMFTPQFIEGFRRGRPWAFSLAAMMAQPLMSALNSTASSAGASVLEEGA